MAKHRIIELDGLRGIAVLLVVAGHYCSFIVPKVEVLELGTIGVDIFFVLSGFLIGGIILDGQAQSGFLWSFYRRRCARILPIYFAVIAAVFIAWHFTKGAPWIGGLSPIWVYLTFTSNFAIAIFGQGGPLFNPAWTLAVEEQFYLVIPLLILLTPKNRLLAVLGTLCVAAIILRAFWGANIAADEVLLPWRMDSLLIGVGAALIQRRFDLARRLNYLQIGVVVPSLAFLLMIALLRQNALAFKHCCYALTTALFILSMINGTSFGRDLRAPWLRYFGEISYGLYLIHEPVRVLLTGVLLGKSIHTPGLDRIPVSLLALALAIALATLSWRYFERPIIQWAARRTPARIAEVAPQLL